MVTTAPVTPARTATPARWAAALSRAVLRNITVSQDPRTGVFTAPSTDGTRRYRVGWYDCQCQAAQGGDPVCLHRAAFREHCREEDRQVARELRAAIDAEPPFPADPAPARPRRMCTDCLDTGWARMYRSGRLSDYTDVPCGCTASHRAA